MVRVYARVTGPNFLFYSCFSIMSETHRRMKGNKRTVMTTISLHFGGIALIIARKRSVFQRKQGKFNIIFKNVHNFGGFSSYVISPFKIYSRSPVKRPKLE